MVGVNTKVIHPKNSKVNMEQRKQSLETDLESVHCEVPENFSNECLDLHLHKAPFGRHWNW